MEEQKKNMADQQPEKQNDSAGGDKKEEKKNDIHNNALYAASMGRAATAQVDPHSNRGLANTGTNISYEGATAPGSGGSVGSGYASGKSAADPSISTDSDYDKAEVGKAKEKNVSGNAEEGEEAK